jgi:hypothetical protein
VRSRERREIACADAPIDAPPLLVPDDVIAEKSRRAIADSVESCRPMRHHQCSKRVLSRSPSPFFSLAWVRHAMRSKPQERCQFRGMSGSVVHKAPGRNAHPSKLRAFMLARSQTRLPWP